MSLTKEDISSIKDLLEPINERLERLEEGQKVIINSQMRFELEEMPKIQAALDGIVASIEKNKQQDERIDNLERKTEEHGMDIFVLKNAVK